jgi:hypothetical protein
MKLKNGRVARYKRMKVEDLHKTTRAFDDEMVVEKSRPLTAAERKAWERARRKPGRPRRGAGAKVIAKRRSNPRFAVCVRNGSYEASLERNKLYVVLPDSDAAREGDIRVVDESGEDYLYPADCFVALKVPKAVQESVLAPRRAAPRRRRKQR